MRVWQLFLGLIVMILSGPAGAQRSAEDVVRALYSLDRQVQNAGFRTSFESYRRLLTPTFERLLRDVMLDKDVHIPINSARLLAPGTQAYERAEVGRASYSGGVAVVPVRIIYPPARQKVREATLVEIHLTPFEGSYRVYDVWHRVPGQPVFKFREVARAVQLIKRPRG